MNKYLLTIVSAAMIAGVSLSARDREVTVKPPAGSIPALNNAPSAPYAPSKVEAKLNIQVKDGTKAVRFIRDNSTPYVVTKAYPVKNADPYSLRGALKTIVSGTVKDSPVAIESVKYVDGSSVLLISAEEYRFKDIGNGLSIDQIVQMLDKKDLPNTIGTVDMAYFPKYNTAKQMLKMMEESGIGFSGANPNSKSFEFNKYGLHYETVSYALTDDKLNAIIMSSVGYDIDQALKFLKEVDVPAGEIQLDYRLVEIYAENDQKLGLDFQAWKNNDGIDFFGAGGKYGTNWSSNGLTPNNGHTFSHFYNFNPKWNTKYVDFLTTCGKAKIVSSGSMIVADGGNATLTLTDGMFSIVAKDIRKVIDEDGEKREEKYTLKDLVPYDKGSGKWHDIISQVAESLLDSHNIREGKTQNVDPADGNLFTMKISGEVLSNATNLNISMLSSSLIGWDGQGKARLTNSSYSTSVQIDTHKKEFVIGGLTKSSVVRSVAGLPILKNIPILGWIFSTETDMVKKSQFVLIATARLVSPDEKLSKETAEETKKISDKVEKAVKCPAGTLGYQQWLIDK